VYKKLSQSMQRGAREGEAPLGPSVFDRKRRPEKLGPSDHAERAALHVLKKTTRTSALRLAEAVLSGSSTLPEQVVADRRDRLLRFIRWWRPKREHVPLAIDEERRILQAIERCDQVLRSDSGARHHSGECLPVAGAVEASKLSAPSSRGDSATHLSPAASPAPSTTFVCEHCNSTLPSSNRAKHDGRCKAKKRLESHDAKPNVKRKGGRGRGTISRGFPWTDYADPPNNAKSGPSPVRCRVCGVTAGLGRGCKHVPRAFN
jgi:hypothetical protein